MEECKDCEIGRAESSSGKNDCDDCKPGEYQDQKGQTSCKDCVAGKWCDSTAATHVNFCQSCPTGKKSTTIAASSADMCITCPAGKHQPSAGATDCVYCPVGQYKPTLGEANCIDCNVRKVTGVPNGALTCAIECLNGYEAKGQQFCTKCPSGKKIDYTQSETECTQCHNEIPYSDGTSCYRCLLGHYTRGCLDCPVGRYAGWESNVIDECYTCAQGYQDEEGRGNCKTCPTGRISSGDRTTCVTCPRGEYSDTENNVGCQVCANGRHHTGIIGQKTSECTQANIYGKTGYTTGGVFLELIELSGVNDDAAINLTPCTGACDGDWQCASGLQCFQRSNGESIPGCSGTNPGAGGEWDYCYDPNTNSSGENHGFQAKIGEVVDNSYTAHTTNCPANKYKNTFDGVCKACPVGLYKDADDNTARIVGPNDFNVCKFCPAGKNFVGPYCNRCETSSNPNKRILNDFPHQDCRYSACPMGSFARSGECVPCPVGTYWEAQNISGISTSWKGHSGIFHECRQMENQFIDSSTAAQRTLMKEDCERCYTNPPPLQDMGARICTDYIGSFKPEDVIIYNKDNPGVTLEEQRDACETACLNFRPFWGWNSMSYGDNIDITGFIIGIKEDNKGKCSCAVNTDFTTCSRPVQEYGYFRTYRFDTRACQKGKALRAAQTTYDGLCRSCPTGQYQDFIGQNICKYCPSAREDGSDTCP